MEGSRQWRAVEDQLIPPALFAAMRDAGPLPVAVPATPEEYLAGCRALLGPLADGSVRQAGELAANRRHAQRLAMLPDGLVLEISHHAVPAQGPDSSTSYSAIVGIGRS